MNELGFEMVTRWAPWKDEEEGQPAGFVTQWGNNVTLATVHGGGHEVPTYVAKTAFQLFAWYLDRTWFVVKESFGPDDAAPAATEEF